jgi:hypothetical protein
MAYVITIECDVTDSAALERQARRLAKACGVNDQEFDHYLKNGSGKEDANAYCLGWLFDHGSPLEHGVQIEQTNAEKV